MFETIIAWVSSIILFLGYPGIVFLMILESMIFPLPSEAILPFAGYLVGRGEMNLMLVTLSATLGSLIGSWISYEIGRYGGRRFLKKYGKYLLLNETHLKWTEGWFARFGDKTIFFSRLIPVVRHFISIPAGMTQMNRTKFFLYTFFGALIWNFFLVLVGVWLGNEWITVGSYTKPVEIAVIIIIAGFFAWLLFWKIEKATMQYFHKK